MPEVLVHEAAAIYGVGEQRIRAMLRSGRLQGRKVGSTWLVTADPDGVRPRPRGRPLSAAHAWAVLALLSHETPGWVDATQRSRLRRWMRDPAWVERALRESAPRSLVHRWYVLPSDLPKLSAAPALISTGLSARDRDLDIVAGRRDEIDAYVDQRSMIALQRRLKPHAGSERPNVVLRLPTHPWILDRSGDAPSPVVAADLLGERDARVRRAAMTLLRKAMR